MSSQLLAVYDPSGKLGLTDPSPGGGEVPMRWRCSPTGNRPTAGCGHVSEERNDDGWCWLEMPAPFVPCGHQQGLLLLRTEDGNEDPLGMARAREVLALHHPCLHTPEDVARGVWFYRGHLIHSTSGYNGDWIINTPGERTAFAAPDSTEDAPEALARLLSQHLGCEVIRG